jgi:hypothetical protein
MAVTIFGIPTDLFVLFLFVVFIFLVGLMRYLGRSFGQIAVKVLWVFKNYTAMRMDAYEDLQGIFIKILGPRRKELETIKKLGRPIEVEEIDEKSMKAYLLKKPKKGEKPLIYLLVKQGRTKSSREFITVEGTGKTLDFVTKAESETETAPGNAPVIQEEQSAAKTFLKLVMSAAESIGNKLLMIGSGVGMGMGLTIFLLLLFGHLK